MATEMELYTKDRGSVPEESTPLAIYPLDRNLLPMEIKEALINSISPKEAKEFA